MASSILLKGSKDGDLLNSELGRDPGPRQEGLDGDLAPGG